MKLLTSLKEGKQTLGIRVDAGIIDLEKALAHHPDSAVETDVMAIIEGGESSLAALKSYVNRLDTTNSAPWIVAEEDIQWGPAVTRPNKIICVGLNYRKHADETGSPYPEVPILFNKFNNTLTGHLAEIAVPKVTSKLDYEVELCIVIGKKAKDVEEKDALNYVFGYCTANDLSARDLQMRTHQWLLGKTCDDFSPIGPYLVTADEVADPQNLQLRTTVNGELRQNSNTSDMIFSCAEIISYISRHMTLVPGDLILTGTPEGVVMGLPEDQQIYLQPGDEVTVEIEQLGALTNRFVAEG